MTRKACGGITPSGIVLWGRGIERSLLLVEETLKYEALGIIVVTKESTYFPYLDLLFSCTPYT